MFDLISFVKGVWRRMFPVTTLKQAIGHDIATSQAMIDRIELWSMMNKGNAPWVNEQIKSLRIEKGICREFSNICLTEMESSVSNGKLDEIYKAAIRDLNENLQNGLALGSFCIKPLGASKVEYITADKFVPVEYDSRGRLIKVVFIEVKTIGENNYYYRFEYHSLDDKGLTITNKAYHTSDIGTLGNEVPLTAVDEWSLLPPSVFYSGVIKPDFGYYRNPIKNDIDDSPAGVSIFDSSINLINKTDVQFGRLDWEFESGERAVQVSAEALIAQNKEQKAQVAKLNKRLYKGLNIEQKDGDLFHEYSPDMRDESFLNGLNAYLRRIEFNASLAYGDLSDTQDVEKTATECRVAKQRKYTMVNAIQDNLKECLEDLVYALAFYNAMTSQTYTFNCIFHDSILTDEETERTQDRQDVAMGVMSLAEYRSKWYGESLEEAEQNLPEQADTLDKE